MTDHLDQAADRAIELANEVLNRSGPAAVEQAAQHLTYLAGLIHGGAATKPTAAPGWDGRVWVHLDDPSEAETAPAVRDLRDQRDRLEGHLGKAEEDREDFRKRWHEAATQRDELVEAARVLLTGTSNDTIQLRHLREVAEQADTGLHPDRHSADRLRRELWAVLDRMPASDDDLIATVRDLEKQKAALIKRLEEEVRGELRVVQQRDRLLAAARAIQRAADLTKDDEIVVELENTIVRIEHELGL